MASVVVSETDRGRKVGAVHANAEPARAAAVIAGLPGVDAAAKEETDVAREGRGLASVPASPGRLIDCKGRLTEPSGAIALFVAKARANEERAAEVAGAPVHVSRATSA
jgi:hypothetical protein